ncbi:helix-turn-helix domain-containing protein [Turicibacter sanguinis]|uniref:helix-turn-helix domain-containing protein n=1 Tax=Turicibacter sanguinis TaxID=154288 RepID=UPI0018A9B3C9|nr:helix-turn-helix transcriptional regulator [Turicibacter sanguinis]MDB8557115.1 helix-turn-helix transcriptional regulator [Turicibacter sanguinis]MDB8559888.1 helix-turn-helix transcriptional regulator [Turicibacter sanguinis]
MESLVNKEGLKIVGSLIKLNRLNQKMSQAALCEGICVSSYLSKIENGEVMPSLEMIELLFEQLAIEYVASPDFIKVMTDRFEEFFEELNFNGFVQSKEIFKHLEQEELKLIHSPLILDYYLVKLAHYCATDERECLEEAYRLLTSVKPLLNKTQRFRYYLYQGIDLLYYHQDYELAKQFFELAKQELETGRLYEMLANVSYKQGQFYQAFQFVSEAKRRYVLEGNLFSLSGIYEFEAMLAYKTGSFKQAIELCERSGAYAHKMNRFDLTLTPLLCKAFIHYTRQESLKVSESLEEIANIQQHFQATWPVLILIECFEAKTVKDFENIEKRCHEEMRAAILLIGFCVTGGVFKKDELSSLIQKYQTTHRRFLLIDEWIFYLLKEYYTSKRQYKEVVGLLKRQQL